MNFLRLLGSARLSIPRVFPLMRDPAVPFWLKAAAVGLGLLIVSPLDLLGDIPVLGVLDDAALLALLASAFVMIARKLRENGLVRVEPSESRVVRVEPREARVVRPAAPMLTK